MLPPAIHHSLVQLARSRDVNGAWQLCDTSPSAYAHVISLVVTASCFIAGMTEIASPLLDRYVSGPDSLFSTLMLARTGERLTRATFLASRKPGEVVIIFVNTPEMEAMAITSPLTAIASDGGLRSGIGHPRAAGTFARVLGNQIEGFCSRRLPHHPRRGVIGQDAVNKDAVVEAGGDR